MRVKVTNKGNYPIYIDKTGEGLASETISVSAKASQVITITEKRLSELKAQFKNNISFVEIK